jgi:UDP:flavonoid glycosyltransferase YjiC (YdhE family)
MGRNSKFPETKRIAYFVTPHGFGHAARSAAVMAAVSRIAPWVHFDIYTSIPCWLFEESFMATDFGKYKTTDVTFSYHDCLTDIGLVQNSPFEEDLPETIKHLEAFLPFDAKMIADLTKTVSTNSTHLILCDISPLGIAVAREAGIPSVLIENFTWDWIYEGYNVHRPLLVGHISYLREIFNTADFHIQTQPTCQNSELVDLITLPVSRHPQSTPDKTRSELGIPKSSKMVLITMGGVQEQFTSQDPLKTIEDVVFVIPGASQSVLRRGQVILLPHHSHFYHPDLIHASDLVIGKVGYSTIAEIYHAGVPFGYISRSKFREAEPLAAYIRENIPGKEISISDFKIGKWVDEIPELLDLNHIQRPLRNGAEEIAEWIMNVMPD